jgi:ABC-type oligopeptide transport system substrate-binding subunit
VANDMRYRSDAVADALRSAALERNLDVALDRYAVVEQEILRDLPVIPLWFSTVPLTARPDVTGIVLDGEGRLDWTRLDR